MPTYEYACSSCAHEWEAEQSIKDAPLADCPRCALPTAKRQISRGTGFILKGSGWYADLYSGSSNKTPEKTAEKKTDAGASGADKGGEGAKGGESPKGGEGAKGGEGSKGPAASSSTPSSSSSSSSTTAAA
jgi:putative FmdB family regulatory protein